jgi:hypothetical protein
VHSSRTLLHGKIQIQGKMGISRGFANPFPQISFAKPKSVFERINTLVERSSDIKVNAKVERKISFPSFQNRFVQRRG